MLKSAMLIIDKRLELGTKYKKACEKMVSEVFLTNNTQDAFETMLKFEPDLILISDSFEAEMSDIMQKIKVFTQNYRPAVVYISKSDLLDDKLKILDMGADDYISEPIQNDEFKARIRAHLRRCIESHISTNTNLYDNKLSLVVLRRTLATDEKWSAMLVSIENFQPYKEVYGTIASEKLMQTYAAIISSSLDQNDFLGTLSENEFLVITTPEKAEKLSAYLVFAFDTIAEKFYSEKDAKNKYIISKNDSTTEEKIGLVCTKIAIISTQNKKYKDIRPLLNDLIETHKLTKTIKKSSFAVDRVKLQPNECKEEMLYNNKIIIVEPDESLCFLLSTTAQMQGYDVKALNDYESLLDDINKYQPAVAIIDIGNTEEKEGLFVCDKIKNDKCLNKIKVILTSTIHNKEEIMNFGADIYLPKPYDLLTMYSWVSKLVKDYNF